jgi:hypothetical protein
MVKAPEFVVTFDAASILAMTELCDALRAERKELEAERDGLRAELATVKAALPRWRKFGHGHRLMSESIAIADVWQSGAYWMSDVFAGHNPKFTNKTREAAMTAVTEALGLPPCEVSDA